MDGVLVVDKPAGPTSSDVVLRVKRLLRAARVGHTGTLDPMATGVLPLCLGSATRLAQFLSDADKSYRATVRLGVRTDTGDAEGRPVESKPVPPLDEARIEAALATLRGPLMQTPPMYSAVKVGGVRLYERARRGEAVERAPRAVTVRRFTLCELAPPDLVVEVECSKGTYVRQLAEDLGARLGTVAHLAALRRLTAAGFGLDRAVALDALERAAPDDRAALVREKLLPPARALDGLPRRTLTPEETVSVRHGRAPKGGAETAGPVALVDPSGALVAVARSDGNGGLVLARVVAH